MEKHVPAPVFDAPALTHSCVSMSPPLWQVIETCLHRILIDRSIPSAISYVKTIISELLQVRVLELLPCGYLYHDPALFCVLFSFRTNWTSRS